jgi:hypothetical protein
MPSSGNLSAASFLDAKHYKVLRVMHKMLQILQKQQIQSGFVSQMSSESSMSVLSQHNYTIKAQIDWRRQSLPIDEMFKMLQLLLMLQLQLTNLAAHRTPFSRNFGNGSTPFFHRVLLILSWAVNRLVGLP